MWITQREVLSMLAELLALQHQGSPPSAYEAWNRDFCALLARLTDEAREADTEAQRKSTAYAHALAALGYTSEA